MAAERARLAQEEAARLSRCEQVAREKLAICWCIKGAFAKHEQNKVGEVLMDPNSKAEVKVRWLE